ncbi:MAG: SPOR domain-containing protein [Amphiplicatus sp.]
MVLIARARAAGMMLAMLMLPACATLRGDRGDIASITEDAQWNAVRAAELEVELAEVTAQKEELARQVAELQDKLKTKNAAPAETVPAPAPAEKVSVPAPPAATPKKPETVVAAADVNRALANSPKPPVDPAPRLVQPSFASEDDTVFENEAGASEIPLTSVLFGVHLASYRAVNDARAGWSKLQRDNPDELGLLEPRIIKVTIADRGDFIRLIAGGFASEEKAGRLCRRLRAKGVFCAVTGFEGEKLSTAGQG